MEYLAEWSGFRDGWRMMKQKERIAWVIVVIAIIGWSVSDNGGAGSGSGDHEAGSSRPHREKRLPTERAGERALREKPVGEITKRSDNFRNRSLRALGSDDPLVRMSSFLEVLSSCDASRLDQVKEALDELKASGISLPGEEAMMHFRAGQLKGGELLAGRTGRAHDFAEMENVRRQYEGWIHADAHAAGHWLDQLPVGKFRDQMAVAYIAANSKDDPLGTLDLVATLHPSQQAAAGSRVVESGTTEDAAVMLRSLGTNPGTAESPYMETMFASLAAKVANGKDPAAVSLIEEHLDQPYVNDSALSLVSAAKAKFDPEGALKWAVEMEAGRSDNLSHGQVVSTVIQAMSFEGLEAAESWAATQPDSTALLKAIEQRKEILQDRHREVDRYDRDD